MDTPEEDLDTTTSLEFLQTKEQREVLDIVAQLHKCGLESILSLPQLVVYLIAINVPSSKLSRAIATGSA